MCQRNGAAIPYARINKNMKGNMIMQTEKKTKISSVHFKYVGTDEQYNAFIKSVIKDYITDDSNSITLSSKAL